MTDRPTKYDDAVRWFKNRRFFVAIFIVAGTIISIGSLTDAFSKFGHLFAPRVSPVRSPVLKEENGPAVYKPQPNVIITDFDVNPFVIVPPKGDVIKASFRVWNQGDAPALECHVWWHSHGAEFAPTGSPLFGLQPKESRTFTVQSFIYYPPPATKQAEDYESFAYIKGGNCESPKVYRKLSVFRKK